ncbi:MAG: accessory factor UbiK family protein [Mariprofundaceae bacterium]|nr:accessory factor UbiK family protein [Mariprofundaceae bacterium]
MASNQKLDDIAEKITRGIRMLGGIKHEADAQVRAIVESALGHFDVVTQERMAVQEAMLSKARGQLDALEARITTLEAQVKERENTAR